MKTLKDVLKGCDRKHDGLHEAQACSKHNDNNGCFSYEFLQKIAIEWVKELQNKVVEHEKEETKYPCIKCAKDMGAVAWITQFFDLKEEDLE